MRAKYKYENILQIIPAQGWYAKYSQEGGTVEYSPLVCFAVVSRQYEDDPPLNHQTEVVGIDACSEGTTEPCDHASNFAGYARALDEGFDPKLVTPKIMALKVV